MSKITSFAIDFKSIEKDLVYRQQFMRDEYHLLSADEKKFLTPMTKELSDDLAKKYKYDIFSSFNVVEVIERIIYVTRRKDYKPLSLLLDYEQIKNWGYFGLESKIDSSGKEFIYTIKKIGAEVESVDFQLSIGDYANPLKGKMMTTIIEETVEQLPKIKEVRFSLIFTGKERGSNIKPLLPNNTKGKKIIITKYKTDPFELIDSSIFIK